MAKFEKRLQARELRTRGWSIKSIASQLEVSPSSSSIWCRDLQLTELQRAILTAHTIQGSYAGRIKGALTNRRKKEERIAFYKEAGRREIMDISSRELLLIGVALYWAEGSRKSKFAFTNSEPDMILLMAYWLERVLGVKKDEFMPRIFINAIHESRIGKVIEFWSRLLGVPATQFGNPVLLKGRPRKVYDNHESYFGVLALGVRRSGELKYRVLGLIDALKGAKKVMPV